MELEETEAKDWFTTKIFIVLFKDKSPVFCKKVSMRYRYSR